MRPSDAQQGPSDRPALAQTHSVRPPWNAILRALREARGITQSGWAARLGVSTKTVLRWEAGTRVPDTGAESGLIALCGERGLLHTYDRGPLAGLTMSSELLQEMLAEARWQSSSGRPPAKMPADVGRGAEVAQPVVFKELSTSRAEANRMQWARSVAHSPLIGRERELATLCASLADPARSESGIVLVAGEPGIGKTRLLAEVAERAGATSWTTLYGRAYHLAGAPPYLPFIELLRAHMRVTSNQDLRAQFGDSATDVAVLLPELHDRLSNLPALRVLAPEYERFQLFEGICDALEGVARASAMGVLLILDDLHWADTPTLQLLQHLCRRAAGLPMRLMLAYRTVDADTSPAFAETLAALAREGARGPLLLPPLDAAQTATLVESCAGVHVAPQVSSAIQRRTEGNPFFVGDMVRHLLAQGRDLSQPTAADQVGMPELVRQTIGARLARLSPTTNELLRAAAILGDGFSLDIASHVSPLSNDDAIAAAEEALSAGVLRAEGSVLHFAHALIGETVYESLSALRRQRLHLAAARAIEQTYHTRLQPHMNALARHFRLGAQGAELSEAIAYTIQAGEAGVGVLAFEDAVEHWQWALARLAEQPEGQLARGRLALRLGALLSNTRYAPRDAVRVLEESVTCFEQAGEPIQAASARVELARALNEAATRDLPRALSELMSAEGVLRGQPDSPAVCDLYARLAGIGGMRMVPIQESLSASTRAIAIAERLGDELRVIRIGATRALFLAQLGQIKTALDLLEELWQRAHRLNDLSTASQVMLAVLMIMHRLLQNPADMLRWIERELLADRMQRARNHILFWRALEALQWSELGEVGRARTILENAGGRDFWSDSHEARILFRVGDWQAATALQQRALDVSRGRGDRWNMTFQARIAASMHRIIGDFERAEQLASEVCQVAADSGHVVLEADARVELARTCAATRRTAQARQNVDRARALLPRTENWCVLGGLLELADAVTSAAEGSSAGAARLFEQALATAQQYATPWFEADVLVDWGRALAQSDATRDAGAKLEAADEVYARCGAGPAWRGRVDAVRSMLSTSG
jgi:DNA-binding transcriptional regulator YiaG/tetratricopeptide (TPR) repeat protein